MNPDDIYPEAAVDERPTVHYIYDPSNERFCEYVESKHCTVEHPYLIVDRRMNDDAWNYFHQQVCNDTKAKAVRAAARDLQRTLDTHKRYVKTYHNAIKQTRALLNAVEAKQRKWRN